MQSLWHVHAQLSIVFLGRCFYLAWLSGKTGSEIAGHSNQCCDITAEVSRTRKMVQSTVKYKVLPSDVQDGNESDIAEEEDDDAITIHFQS